PLVRDAIYHQSRLPTGPSMSHHLPVITKYARVATPLWAIGLCLLTCPAFAQTSPTPEPAPLNPEFVHHQNARGLSRFSAGGHALGHIPSPLMRPKASVRRLVVSRSSLPATYDLRALGRLGPVRDQGGCGDCWAFGALASLESALLPGENWDFSENNLKN